MERLRVPSIPGFRALRRHRRRALGLLWREPSPESRSQPAEGTVLAAPGTGPPGDLSVNRGGSGHSDLSCRPLDGGLGIGRFWLVRRPKTPRVEGVPETWRAATPTKCIVDMGRGAPDPGLEFGVDNDGHCPWPEPQGSESVLELALQRLRRVRRHPIPIVVEHDQPVPCLGGVPLQKGIRTVEATRIPVGMHKDFGRDLANAQRLWTR